ncbi:MAG: response regulator [Planctomycetales bacterium]|nr:response regulator [Planctomycetales bacterium]
MFATNDLVDRVFELLSTTESEADFFHSPVTNPWVLLVEDDDDVACSLQMRLKELNAEVIRAAAGREGYRRAFMEMPRAIILDYELPDGNGDYVLRRLKETRDTQQIPVVVMTGCRDSKLERHMLSLGAAHFLTKPVPWPQLKAVLSPLIGKNHD